MWCLGSEFRSALKEVEVRIDTQPGSTLIHYIRQ
jgi:hypothetical protein